MTRTCGAASASTVAIPATSPPPPSGTTTVPTSGTCSRSSRATVPCPVTTSRWSKGWMSVRPERAASARAATSASSTEVPTCRTWAPYPRVAASLGTDASTGMYTTASMPSICAASATPCAWLPALAATTPRAFSSSGIRDRRVYAPRILNEPARCRFSHLRTTGAPATSDIARNGCTGVRVTTPSSSRAAARTSSRVTRSISGGVTTGALLRRSAVARLGGGRARSGAGVAGRRGLRAVLRGVLGRPSP